MTLSPYGTTGTDSPKEALEGIVRFETRTSTNSKIAGLTRGSQGLGAKITAAVSYCVCQSEPREGAVTISTRGCGKLLEIRANEIAGIPQATIQDVPPDVKSGTSVSHDGIEPVVACQKMLKRTCDAVSLVLDAAERLIEPAAV